MLNRTLYYSRASMALLLFVFLGYVVKFYPEQLSGFDQPLQSLIRGDLPEGLTAFFLAITRLGDTLTQVVWVLVLSGGFLVWKNWRAEAALMVLTGGLAGGLIFLFKLLYARPRPALPHLVEATGYSFPSGHSTGSLMIFGVLLIVISQRMAKGPAKQLLLAGIVLLIALIGLSRVYLGVHYPSDILAGFSLGYAVLNLLYPTYMMKRFEWRFKGWSK